MQLERLFLIHSSKKRDQSYAASNSSSPLIIPLKLKFTSSALNPLKKTGNFLMAWTHHSLPGILLSKWSKLPNFLRPHDRKSSYKGASQLRISETPLPTASV